MTKRSATKCQDLVALFKSKCDESISQVNFRCVLWMAASSGLADWRVYIIRCIKMIKFFEKCLFFGKKTMKSKNMHLQSVA